MSENHINHKKRTIILIFSIAGTVTLIAAMVAFLLLNNTFGNAFERDMQKVTASYPEDERFSAGISIAGVDVANLTKAEALEVLQQAELYPSGYHIQLTLEDQTVTVTGKELPFDLHLQETIEEAYAYNWHCTEKERTYRAAQLSSTPKDFSLNPTLIENELETVFTELTTPFEKAAKEPTITGYKNGVFEISDPVNGHTVNIATLISEIKTLLSTKKTGVIEVPITVVQSKKTAGEVKANIQKLGSFSTISTNSANGNHNMKLAANATNGTVLQPGEQFSFNNTTGNTTNSSNGYLPAGAISGGEFVQEYGGGICQVSTTIYGAALRSNMTIVSRYNHTYPSTYVPIGLDAAVSYGTLDLVIRNDSEYPVYIEAGMDGKTVWVTFYGYQSPDYDTIEVNGWITENIPKPQAQYNTDNSLTPNPNPMSAARLKKSGSPGYKTASSRTYYKNGVAVKTETLSSSYYPAFADVYLIPPKGTAAPESKPETAPESEPIPESTPESELESTPESEPETTPPTQTAA